jgi:hypothetical protein
MYKGLSHSPQYGSFAFGTNPGPSDLENLVAGRERKLSDLVDQSVVERQLSGQKDVPWRRALRMSAGILVRSRKMDSVRCSSALAASSAESNGAEANV